MVAGAGVIGAGSARSFLYPWGMVERRIKDRFTGAERWSHEVTVLGKGLVFEGEIRAKDVVVIGGRVVGPVHSEALVHILPGGVVRGEVTGNAVLVEGAVDGDISAKDQLELGRTGRVRGDVYGPRVAVAEGAYLKGQVKATAGKIQHFRERRGS